VLRGVDCRFHPHRRLKEFADSAPPGVAPTEVERRDFARRPGSGLGSARQVPQVGRHRRRPDWPYNLIAMVHGGSRDEVLQKVSEIVRLLGQACRAHDVLFSTEILKKAEGRLGD